MMQGGPLEELIYEDNDSDVEMPGLVSDSEDSDSESDPEIPSLVSDPGRESRDDDDDDDDDDDESVRQPFTSHTNDHTTCEVEVLVDEDDVERTETVLLQNTREEAVSGATAIVTDVTPHSYKRSIELSIRQLASKIRPTSTLPLNVDVSTGESCCQKHCAFERCGWTYVGRDMNDDGETALDDHLREAHWSDFQIIHTWEPTMKRDYSCYDLYTQV